MGADFAGWATKFGLECSDGKTIMPDTFKGQDSSRVPLVYQHGHNDPEMVLGHADLTHIQGEGIWAEAHFNSTPKAQHSKEAVTHGDITQMSIFANQLIQRANQVFHGVIREVSLVIAGANPGATIEQLNITHSDGFVDEVADAAIITTGIELKHGDELNHMEEDEDDSDDGEELTVQGVYDSLNDEQKELVHIMLEKASEKGGDTDSDDDEGELKQDDTTPDPAEEQDPMTTRNVFEKDGNDSGDKSATLTHADKAAIFADAQTRGSLREAVLAHGITDIEALFPEARNLDTPPEWDKRDTSWVAGVLSKCRKSPFSRIKTRTADLTYEDARARGYIKGDLKKDQWFSTAHRVTTPQTIYKRQKIDRDDIIDITDFDVVSWMKSEMKGQLEEEIARAILFGDGRDIGHADKIQETNVRPVSSDDPYYTVTMGVGELVDDNAIKAALDAMVLNRQFYKGTGTPVFYTSETFVSRCLVLRDADGHRMFRTEADLAAEMRVSSIMIIEMFDQYPDMLGILVNLSDYVIGADRGGKTTMFDDFDIDYNQYTYLIETRICGALTKPRSCMVLMEGESGDTGLVPTAPTYDHDTYTVTVPTQTGVTYIDQNGDSVAAGDTVLTAGQALRLTAVPNAGYFFTGGKNYWSYLRPGA